MGVERGIPVEPVVVGQPGAAGGTGIPAAENAAGSRPHGGVRPLLQLGMQVGVPGLKNRPGTILIQGEADGVAALRHPDGVEGLAAEEGIPLPHRDAAAAGLAPPHENISLPGRVSGPIGQLPLVVGPLCHRRSAGAVEVKGDVIGRGRVGGRMPIDFGVPGENMALTVLLAANGIGEPAHGLAVKGLERGPIGEHAVCAGDLIHDMARTVKGVVIVVKADDMGAVRCPHRVERGIPLQLAANPDSVFEIPLHLAPAPEHISYPGGVRRKLCNPSAAVRLHRAGRDRCAAVGVKGDLVGDSGSKEIPAVFPFQLIAVSGDPLRRVLFYRGGGEEVAVKVPFPQAAKAALLIQNDLLSGGQRHRGAAQGARTGASGGNLLRVHAGVYIHRPVPHQYPHAVFHQDPAAVEKYRPLPGQVDAAGKLGGLVNDGTASHRYAGTAPRILPCAQEHRLALAAENHAASYVDLGFPGGPDGRSIGLYIPALDIHCGADAVLVLLSRPGAGNHDGGGIRTAAPDGTAEQGEGAAELYVDHLA